MTDRVYQVGEIATEMRDLLEMSYSSVWIEGELSALSKPASGHLYFTLKDDQAQIRCAMFRSQASRMRISPKVGDLVKIRGKISVYTARGDLQCIVQSMDNAGEGQLHRAFEMLKQKLLEQGLFDTARKRTIPRFPKNIGVISSSNAAALHDVLTTLARRCPGIPVTLYPSLVQGDDAPAQLIQAIQLANQAQRSDVLILARGGGSIEDLWGFNDEHLAHAIVDSAIPIISAVGHEVDVTIADFAADLRAPTPTAAAELVAPDTQSLLNTLNSLKHRSVRQIQRRFEGASQKLDAVQYRLVHPAEQLKQKHQQLKELARLLQKSFLQQEKDRKNRLLELSQRSRRIRIKDAIATRALALQRASKQLRGAAQKNLQTQQSALASLSENLQLVSPLGTLQRGYSIARDKDHTIVRQASQVTSGDQLNVQLGKGNLDCVVKKVNAS